MQGDPEDPLEQRLGVLVREWPDLGGAAEVYRVTLPLLRSVGPIAASRTLTGDQARTKLSKDEFLLHGAALVFDHNAARELMLGLARNLENVGLVAMSPIRSALEGGRLIPEELLGHVADGDYPSLAARAEEQALDPPLLWTLAQSALKPTLRAWCGELAPLVHTAGEWEKACCFICGAPASLGELQGNEQAKHLRCGQCGADWLIRRLQCIYCGNEDTSLLGILYPEGRRENVRVEVCDKCHGYLKVVARFTPCSPEELAVEDLSTLYLDCLAQGRGYRRPLLRRDGP
ncbi:MAG: formate dehydrogenase accessory protein FdhE [Deltaproteobacteria bacterium]|nr:formate dehydrogenase accessory protein FdhE [Deltaproteobacteria bacterium]